MKRLARNRYKIVAGRYYGTPKELWGFRTETESGGPESIAGKFLRANAALLGLSRDLAELQQRPARVIESLGATHVILQQTYLDMRIHRAYVTVHIDPKSCVYMAKNRAIPSHLLPAKPGKLGAKSTAVETARRAIDAPRSACRQIGQTETLWYPYRDTLRPARKVRLHRSRPREEWIAYIDARTGHVLDLYDNLAALRGRARVFDPNPVIALGDHRRVTTAAGKPRKKLPDAAYETVYLRDLDESGYVQGKRVTTAPTRGRMRRTDREFFFDARRRKSHTGFKETMVYFHIDSAIRYLETLGYSGPRAIFTAPVAANVKGTRADNSWYSPGSRQLAFGTGSVDDAEDAETILHEFGHALQDAIVPDFGQSSQAAAMGEGFGDYFAASFFASKKDKLYETSVMTWDGVTFDENDPPCVRRVDES